MADDCGCRFQYVNGENERIWLATANSELRSALLKAEQEIERLRGAGDDIADLLAGIASSRLDGQEKATVDKYLAKWLAVAKRR